MVEHLVSQWARPFVCPSIRQYTRWWGSSVASIASRIVRLLRWAGARTASQSVDASIKGHNGEARPREAFTYST